MSDELMSDEQMSEFPALWIWIQFEYGSNLNTDEHIFFIPKNVMFRDHFRQILLDTYKNILTVYTFYIIFKYRSLCDIQRQLYVEYSSWERGLMMTILCQVYTGSVFLWVWRGGGGGGPVCNSMLYRAATSYTTGPPYWRHWKEL